MPCKGCKDTGVNIFSRSGYCACQRGTELRKEDDAKAEAHFATLDQVADVGRRYVDGLMDDPIVWRGYQ